MSTIPSITPTLADNPVQGLVDLFLRANFRAPGASTHAGVSDNVFFWIYAISTFFFVLLMVLMVYFSLRYRRQPGRAPERSRSHNTFLELSWSVIPTIILVWMFFEGFWGYTDAIVAPVNATELQVTGQKWNWSINYPNGAASPISTRTRRMDTNAPEEVDANAPHGAVDTPIFVVPEDKPVSLRMSSIDVIHSFWIPDFRVKFDVFPNRYTSLWFQTKPVDWADVHKTDKTKAGLQYKYQDHWVFCTEYCGDNHSEMYAVCRVVSQADYGQIIKEWAEPTGTPVEIGQALYKIKGCNACHTLDGGKNVGPTWKNMYGHAVQFSDGSSRTDEQMTGTEFANYVRESVLTPAAKIVQGYPNQMQSYDGRLNPKEIAAIIAFQSSNLLTDRPAPDLSNVLKPEQLNLFKDTAGTPSSNQPTPGTPSNIPGAPSQNPAPAKPQK
jgi:cytochrome c oxidase subunit 2